MKAKLITPPAAATPLAPCPFCGAPASARHLLVDDQITPLIECTRRRACQVVMYGTTVHDAVIRWNRRAQVYQPPPLPAHRRPKITPAPTDT